MNMTPLGWVLAISVWTLLLTLNVCCFWKVFRKKESGDGDRPAP